MIKLLAQFYFWLTGWKIAGEVPSLKKYVVIMAPHTSAWDLVVGLCAKYIFGLDFKFLVKAEAFKSPFGPIFRALGAIPVERSSSHNLVDQAVELFNTNDEFVLTLAPEGTRAYVEKWKTGFYYIALKAKVPISLAFINFETKRAGFGPLFYPTGDIEKDMKTIMDFYRPIKGKHPELGVR